MKKLMIAVVVMLTGTWTLADSGEVVGCQAGLLGARFSGATTLDTASLPSAGTQLGVFLAPPQMYVANSYDISERTTYSFSGYMWMDANVTYNFNGNYDDFTGVKIENTWLFTNNGSGNYKASADGWYAVDFRCGNNGGPGGGSTGIRWKKSTESEWHQIADDGNGELFRTQKVSGKLPRTVKCNPKTWEN